LDDLDARDDSLICEGQFTQRLPNLSQLNGILSADSGPFCDELLGNKP